MSHSTIKIDYRSSVISNQLRNRQWSDTFLGAVEEWPVPLRSVFNICLALDIPAGICWGNDYLFFYNDAWKTQIGDDYPLGQPARPLMEDKWPDFASCVRKARSTGKVVSCGNNSLSFAGYDERHAEVSFYPVPDDQETGGGVVILADKTANTTRAEPEDNRTFEKRNAGFGILKVKFKESDTPTDGLFLETNAEFVEYTDVREKEAEGEHASKLVPKLDNRWFERFGRVALTGESIQYDYHSEELGRWFEISAFRIGWPEERKVAALFNDITKRKQDREKRDQLLREIRRDRKQLSEFFHYAPSFMCVLRGPDHVFERANELYRKLVGKNRELIGRPLREVLPEVEGQGFFERLDNVYETGEPVVMTDIPIKLDRHPESNEGLETRYLDLVYQPLRNSDGSVNGIFAQGVDLTERHHAKEKLQAMNNTLEKRVEKRTRELRSYQKKLQSLASRLNEAEEQERQRLAAELHDNLGQMLSLAKMQVDRLQRDHFSGRGPEELRVLREIVNDALDYNQNLMVELKPPPVLNKEDVTEVLQWTANEMKKQGLDIEVHDDGKPKTVDKQIRTTLHQSVRELLLNVIKHADTRKARIHALRKDQHVKITVRDQGKGFDVQKHLLKSTEEGRFGLFNIQERINWHGGAFEINSEPGRGTKATLYAPLKEQAAREVSPRADMESVPPADKKEEASIPERNITVMLVDDHDMVRRGFRQMIEKQEDISIVAEASNGREAVELADEKSADVILMDVNMPVMDGIEATKTITGSGKDTRIIALSLHNSQEVIQNMKSAGASAYLTKTDAFETLIKTIRAHA
ncbi:response regulator [Fodinibius sp.]|uniref:response regulator n=1 Tax=Fodinibius sp. TaxID=1872440 RepID=UPI00356456BF